MLLSLNISNIVLIEKLNLEFGAGLNILTGETGAGKSILLDALSLALGARSDIGLIRHGCDNASVSAEFDTITETIKNILIEAGIDCDDSSLVLRRCLSQDGKSRAWINGEPVSIKTLKQVGDALVEIHGQFANHALLNPATHRETLDLFAINNFPEYEKLLNNVKALYYDYNTANKRLRDLEDMLSKAESEREFLEHNVAELKKLNVKIGEEEELSNKRTLMMNAEKDASILKEAVETLNQGGRSLDSSIFSVAHILERIKTEPNPYQEQIDKLYDMGQAIAEIAQQLSPEEIDVENIDSIEERLFAIRAIARKHRVLSDELPAKLETMEQQLNSINNSDAELKKAKTEVKIKKEAFEKAATELTSARKLAANELRNRLLSELPDLKLGQADFEVEISEGPESSYGKDEVLFLIKTNPGSPFAPLHKSASGGELARLMLAMKVVLAGQNSACTFVFDEVDTGISGATASAVGQRLNRLAENSQALVITHSAQVAGFANRHFKIEKDVKENKTTTSVRELTNSERINEIARIISGAEITPESIATAKTLIKF